jgi:nitrite reductase/ring-hydroxylating ferredoxin subunit
LAQPSTGKVVAFTAICTHQGCTVNPDGAVLRCPCHASTYDAFTGKNTSGPAQARWPPSRSPCPAERSWPAREPEAVEGPTEINGRGSRAERSPVPGRCC